MLDGPATGAPTPAGSPPPGDAAPPNRRLRIVLAYLWLLALVPFFAEKDDPEVRWHARHGLLLFGAEMAVFFLMSVLGPISGLLERLVVPVAQIGIVILHGLCIARGLQGGRLQIPGLSEYADRL